MGLAMGRLLGWKQEARIVLLGLACAGKTAILHKLKHGHVVTTGPTIGFNTETLEYNGISFSVWDVGGSQGELLRLLLRHYLYAAQGVIFVVDSSDQEWFHQAKDLLNMILNEDKFRDPALLLFATKQDLPNAMSAAEIADKLGLQSLLCNRRRWHIQSCCAISGEGLHEGMDWLCTNIQ
ncbi:hypothetical protein BDA96_04G295500 [Sorghum bicolor]|uniref:ADP-ribosylation factor n=1 Tax=Sorghum bicolor TaxID=4558 RepID=A0A921UKP2_SORBI|nr:hypothetical protein BDA96_04G295500 [Sorghum bicolor]KAG0534627.1 hypothetical protein BDA96_04G295500 [Sorghum bicolor]